MSEVFLKGTDWLLLLAKWDRKKRKEKQQIPDHQKIKDGLKKLKKRERIK